MQRLRHFLCLVFMSALAATAHSQAPTTKAEQMAEELFETTVVPMAGPVVDRLLQAAAREGQMPDAARQIYRDFALEMFRSKMYRAANVKAYVATFTEEELKTLLELSKHSGYALFLARGQRISELTYPTYAEILKEQRPLLLQRLKEAGLAR